MLELGNWNNIDCGYMFHTSEIKQYYTVIVPRLFEEKRRDIVFGLPSILPSFRPPKVLCTLCAQLLLQFYADLFETLQMFLSWSEDMHVLWILSCDYFLSLFLQFELSHFLGLFTIKVNR